MEFKYYKKSYDIKREYIDYNNHVNNYIFLKLMQDIAESHFIHVNYTHILLKSMKTTWVVKKHEINYTEPILLNDQILLKTWISKVNKYSAVREYIFSNFEENKTYCHAKSIFVFIDIEKNKPLKICDELKNLFI